MMSQFRKCWAIGLVITLALLGCQAGAPKGLTDSDRQAIREATRIAVQMANEKADWSTYTEHYYAPDAVVLPPNTEAIKGQAEIISFLESFPPIANMQVDHVEMDGAGDVAYVYGTYSLTMVPEEGEPIKDTGKYIEVWKRQADGSWKVALDIFNSDLPAAGSETEM